MAEEYKVIKLKSGEELIAEISETTSDKITLCKPMIFKTIVVSDMNGVPKEGVVLKNWLAYGTQTETTIPSDFVATILDPSSDVITYYLYEKERQSGKYVKTSVEDFTEKENKNELTEPKNIEDYENMITKMFENIFKDMEKEEQKIEEKRNKKRKNQPSKQKKQHMIHMNLLFTPEALAHMINNGFIDPRDIMDMIEHFGLNKKKPKRKNNRESINDKKYTGNEKDREDFGNKWTDWNPDPNSDDYN